jgi:hypothetical protein
MVRWAGLLLALILLPFSAFAEGRIALLIGNEAYTTEIGRLANPHNDVALLEQALKGLGFDVVTVRDAGLGELNRAVNGYVRRLQAVGPNGVGFFYYSGHGASDAEARAVKEPDAGNLTGIAASFRARPLQLVRPPRRLLRHVKRFVPPERRNGLVGNAGLRDGRVHADAVGMPTEPHRRGVGRLSGAAARLKTADNAPSCAPTVAPPAASRPLIWPP